MTYTTSKPLVRVGIAAAAFALCYAGVLLSLVDQWSTNSTASYGFAVPLISSYIVWSRWSEIKGVSSAPDYPWGVALVLAGLGMLSIGHLGALTSLQGLSIIPTLAGLVLLLAGRPVLRVVWFPLAYLLLMLPFWSYLVTAFQEPSQQLSATIATRALRGLGIPAFQQGTRIALSSATLDVMAECSGINQLIALTVMALPAAYLWLGTNVTRIALIAIAVVVGYFSNGARITVLGLLTAKGVDVSNPHSLIHLLPGFLTASIAYLVIWGCLSLFSRLSAPTPAPASPAQATSSSATGRRLWIEAVTLALMVSVAAAQLMATAADVRSHNELQSLPGGIGDWTAESSAAPQSTRFPGFDVDLVGGYPTPSGQRQFLKMDEEILRAYESRSGRRVRLYIGYYARQENGKELSSDVSRALQHVASELTVRSESNQLTLKEVVQSKDDYQRGVVFWYDVNGRTTASLYRVKGYTLWDTLTRRRSNGAVIMIAWDSRDGASRQDAIAFAQALLPVLREHLPS